MSNAITNPEALAAERSPEKIQAMFCRVACCYDLLNTVLFGGMDRYWRGQLVRAVQAQHPARVLDLATGSGDVLLALTRRKAFTECAVGADFCLPMLQIARAKKATNLVVADGLQLPFVTASFDAITISFGLRNWVDRLAGLREMRRLLRPGGAVYVLEVSHLPRPLEPLYFWYLRHILPRIAALLTPEKSAYAYLSESVRAFPRQAELASLLREAGFTEVTWRNLTGGAVALHIGRHG